MLLFITILLVILYYIFLGLLFVVGIPYLIFKIIYVIVVPKEKRKMKKKHGLGLVLLKDEIRERLRK